MISRVNLRPNANYQSNEYVNTDSDQFLLNFSFFIIQQYEEWKKNLPDTDWVKELVPDIDINKFSKEMMKAGEKITETVNEMNFGKSYSNIRKIT